MRPYLAFQYSGEYFRYIGMPFGIKSAPRVFTHIMRATMTEIRKRWGISSVQYLDDLLFVHGDPVHLQRTVIQITDCLTEFGWSINWTKSQLTPTRRFVFLGILWNTETMRLEIDKDRNERLRREVRKWIRWSLRGKRVAVRQLAKLIGQLSQTRIQHIRASLFLNKMNAIKTQAVKASGWNAVFRLTTGIIGELMWWNTQLKQNKPNLIRTEGVTATMYTDASPRGWGGWIQVGEPREQKHWVVQGVWSEKMMHTSNYKEMLAVLMCLKHFLAIGILNEVRVIHLRTDNTTVMYDVNRKRAATTLVKPLQWILDLTEREDLQITASHVPGVENGIADSLSRLALSGDYQLRQEIFCRGLQELNTNVEVDLFATRQNKKIRNFVSIDSDPQALARDAFSLEWKGFLPLIHPPIPVILRCLRKVVEERVKGVMVLPDWRGQPWNHLLQMVTIRHVNLGNTNQVLIQGAFMARSGQLLPPGTMIMCLVDGGMNRDGECGGK
jgi:ribonuclease HI